MEISGFDSSAHLEMDDPLLILQQYWEVEEMIAASAFNEEIFDKKPQQSMAPPPHGTSQVGESRPVKQLRRNSSTSTCKSHFVNPSRDHILAERKRREKVSQRIIALSTLLPGLKKTDKASILEEAIKYMKKLQEKEKNLEKKITKTATMACVKRRRDDDGTESSVSITNESSFPVIRARCYNSELLISIHCDRRNGVLEKVVGQIESLHLSVASSSLVRFGDYALNITIIAEMEKDYSLSIMELVNYLRAVLKI